MGIKEEFDQGYIGNDIGVVTGSATAVRFPNLERSLVRFKADESNISKFMIGENPENCLFPIYAGNDLGWIPVKNLNELWYSSPSGSTGYLYYWAKV